MALNSAVILLLTINLVSYFIRKIIYISHKKHLFDEPSENRKIHLQRTPNLGGVAIFFSLLIVFSLFLTKTTIPNLNYLIASVVILFLLGLTDDLVGLNPVKKILAQIVVALLVTIPEGFRFTNLHGIFGIHEIPLAASVGLTVFFILLIINAFNLIDGINCLAGSIGLIACLMFAYFFWRLNDTGFMYLALSMAGCLMGFLYYNRTPARIFMGDTGSLLLGFVIALFSINFIELNKPAIAGSNHPVFLSAPAIVLGLLIIPVFDTLRIFTVRILTGKSPFRADRNHIHHRLLDLKFSHLQSTGILALVTFVTVTLAFSLSQFDNTILFILITTIVISLNWIMSIKLFRQAAKTRKAGSVATQQKIKSRPILVRQSSLAEQ